jgi:hypothetical protein
VTKLVEIVVLSTEKYSLLVLDYVYLGLNALDIAIKRIGIEVLSTWRIPVVTH